MIRFDSDYLNGAIPEIMQRLGETNMESTPGYGMDEYCEKAATLIKERCGEAQLGVHFMVGGTQTNLTLIAAALRPHQAVIASDAGHISVHETGAIEATGHKVICVKSEYGKISAEQVEQVVKGHWDDETHEHIAQPAMVYISQSTESGTCYSLAELESISAVCKAHNLIFYVDGARLGAALVAEGNDVYLPDLARLCDAFYIGGTKLGALFGEALVIRNESLNKDFRYIMKQRGGMLAKGRLLGVQFETLFTDGLYERVASHEVGEALRIRRAFEARGIELAYPSYTNQQFPLLTLDQIAKLREKYSFSPWEKGSDGKEVVRFCTSWATKTEDVDALIRDIEGL